MGHSPGSSQYLSPCPRLGGYRQPDGWHIGTCRSYLASGLGYQLNHDAQIAYLITNSDGHTRLRDIIAALASQSSHPIDAVSRSALHAAKLLVGHGLMLPAV